MLKVNLRYVRDYFHVSTLVRIVAQALNVDVVHGTMTWYVGRKKHHIHFKTILASDLPIIYSFK